MSSPIESYARVTAQFIGISTPLIITGGNLCLSWLTTNLLADPKFTPPQTAIQQINRIFTAGAKGAPRLAILSAAALGYLAYISPPGSRRRWRYLQAVGWTLAIMPFTVLIMLPRVNVHFLRAGKLHDAGEDGLKAYSGGDKGLRENLRAFGAYNLVRAGLTGLSGIMAILAVFDGGL